MEKNIVIPLILTSIAGLSTGIGSLIAFLMKKPNRRFFSLMLGFSAGVMIYISLLELLPQSQKNGYWLSTFLFFIGILVTAFIDFIIPKYENPHENLSTTDESSYAKSALMISIAVAIHNFPEGIATFITALKEPNLGISITAAIAIHNIPEGIAVSMPIYYVTKNRQKAFLYSFLTGLSEPIGALIAYSISFPIISSGISYMLLSLTAGIMVFISFDELLPLSAKYGHHSSIYGIILGMLIMAISLGLF